MCSVAIKVLEPDAFNAESQYFIPLFNTNSWLCWQHPKGNEASNGGCNSGPTGHDFLHNANIWFLCLPWESDPSQNVKTGSVLNLDARWKRELFSSPVRTFNPVLIFDSHWPVLTENWTQNQRWFSLSRWEPPNTDYDHNVPGKFIKFPHNKMQISSLPKRRFSIMHKFLLEVKISFFWVLWP
jgi:hypothetical protein